MFVEVLGASFIYSGNFTKQININRIQSEV